MIAIDTNILVRVVVRDDPVQTAQAENLLRKAQADAEPVIVSLVVVIEAVWTLRRAYRLRRNEVVTFLDRLTANRAVQLTDRELIVKALGLYRTSTVDFADIVIALRATMEGARKIFSFDQEAIDANLFSPVP